MQVGAEAQVRGLLGQRKSGQHRDVAPGSVLGPLDRVGHGLVAGAALHGRLVGGLIVLGDPGRTHGWSVTKRYTT